MDLICENYFEKKYERRIESFEKETLLGIFEIIDKMHKHSIEDYKNVIDYHLNDENGEITDSIKFEKVYSEQFYLMFDDIAEEFEYRLKTLKYELIKKLDIKKRDIKKLQVITEENESENESESDLPNKPNKPYIEDLKTLSKLKPGDMFNGIKYMGPYNKDTNTRKTQEKKDTVEDKND